MGSGKGVLNIARMAALAAGALLASPALAFADGHAAPLHPDPWSVLPFLALLAAIALLPIIASHFWHSNFRRFLISAGLASIVVVYLVYYDQQARQAGAPVAGLPALEHSLLEYVNFIVLLGALYAISGGIVIQSNVKPSPFINSLFLVGGAVLANLVGTTGASMLLIRPILRINFHRTYKNHIPIFFIFMVSNCGGLLTPLGDPPLFLGYLRGVPFDWTFRLVREWGFVNALLLVVFLIWDSVALMRDKVNSPTFAGAIPFRIQGMFNFVLLGGVIGAVLLQAPSVKEPILRFLGQYFDVNQLFPDPESVERPLKYWALLWPSVIMLVMAMLSMATTSRELREANDFNWEAIIEVAVLFLGIFITMVPAFALLQKHSPELGLTEPWQYFWLTGGLSSFLDNAPTYLAFATIANQGEDIANLTRTAPVLLEAISTGAVFLGAMTYIGNGPNFMVKAIAEGSGYRMPSFFGYMVYSCFILLPIFGALCYLVFIANVF